MTNFEKQQVPTLTILAFALLSFLCVMWLDTIIIGIYNWSLWDYLPFVTALIVAVYTLTLCCFHRYWIKFLIVGDPELDRLVE